MPARADILRSGRCAGAFSPFHGFSKMLSQHADIRVGGSSVDGVSRAGLNKMVGMHFSQGMRKPSRNGNPGELESSAAHRLARHFLRARWRNPDDPEDMAVMQPFFQTMNPRQVEVCLSVLREFMQWRPGPAGRIKDHTFQLQGTASVGMGLTVKRSLDNVDAIDMAIDDDDLSLPASANLSRAASAHLGDLAESAGRQETQPPIQPAVLYGNLGKTHNGMPVSAYPPPPMHNEGYLAHLDNHMALCASAYYLHMPIDPSAHHGWDANAVSQAHTSHAYASHAHAYQQYQQHGHYAARNPNISNTSTASSEKVAAQKRRKGGEGAPKSEASLAQALLPAHHTRPNAHESLHAYLHSSMLPSTTRSDSKQEATYSPALALGTSEAQRQHWAYMQEMLHCSSAPTTAPPPLPLHLPHHAHLAHAAHSHLQQGDAPALPQVGREGAAAAGTEVARRGMVVRVKRQEVNMIKP